MNPQGQPQTGRRKLGEILLGAGVIDELQLGTALGHQRQWGGRLGNILIDLHFIDDATLASTLAQQLGLRLIDLASEKIDLDVVRLVPQSLAERHNAFPVHYDPRSRESLTVAFSDPTNLAAVDEIRFQTGKTLRIVVAPEGQIAQAIRRYYAGEEPTITNGEAGDASAGPSPSLFGRVNGDLAGPEEEDLAELEPIPSDSQISLNIRDLGLAPAPAVEAPSPAIPPASDPLAGFLEGAARQAASPSAPIAALPVAPIAQSPGTGLPQAFRSTPFLGTPPPPAGPPGGMPPVLSRVAVAPVPLAAEGVEAPKDGARRRESDIFAQAVDLSKKTVEGFIPSPDLLRSRSSTDLAAAPSAFASPPAESMLPEGGPASHPPPQWELHPPPGVPPAPFTRTDVRGAVQSLEQFPGAATLPAAAQGSAVDGERFARALARLLIERGLIQESDLLAKLAEEAH